MRSHGARALHLAFLLIYHPPVSRKDITSCINRQQFFTAELITDATLRGEFYDSY